MLKLPPKHEHHASGPADTPLRPTPLAAVSLLEALLLQNAHVHPCLDQVAHTGVSTPCRVA